MSYSYSLKKSKQKILTRNSIINGNSNKNNTGTCSKLNEKFSFRTFEKKHKYLQQKKKQLEEVEEVEEDEDDTNEEKEEEEEEEEINNNILSKYGFFYDEHVLNDKKQIKNSINKNETQLEPTENNTNNSDINRLIQEYSYQVQNEKTADQEDLSNLLPSSSYITNESAAKCASENFNLNEFNLKEADYDDEKPPSYKLRANEEKFSSSINTNANNNHNCDWIRAPSYFDEQQISELTNEQIQFTLDYFILSGYRVSQMTKTYYDIEAVTKLLDEKERDLELAATIGKQLLEKDQQLEAKIEYLEIQLEKTTEMVNQLRHDINLKDNLLKSFIDSESDSSQYTPNDSFVNKKSNKYLFEKELSECKKKISDLEDENDLLRNRADYFEKETSEMEKKDSAMLESCFRELELSQAALLNTQDELKAKTEQCSTQQEEIQNLFSKIFELQLIIKNLTKDNCEMQSVYESSTADLINQLNEMKERYNECLQILQKTQEEICVLRKKHQSSKQRTSSSNLSSANNFHQINIESILCDEECSNEQCASNRSHSNSVNAARSSYSIYSPWIPSNSNSLATEVFCTLAKDYQAKNSNLPKQTSQSSEFIKKVKQKLTKQVPGSHLDSCLQSDSEIDMMNNSSSSINPGINSFDLENAIFQQNQRQQYSMNGFPKFTNCPTPDSVLSTGSASFYSNLINRSCSFILPEKLKIVKPIEGSHTLQHWQHLARPNLGCLFESRPGISIKGSQMEMDIEMDDDCEDIKNEHSKLHDVDDDLDLEYDDGVQLDMYDDEYTDEGGSLILDTSSSQDLNYFSNSNKSAKHLNQQLSPSRVEFLSRLLENEERRQQQNDNTNAISTESSSHPSHMTHSKERNFFLDMIQALSSKYFSSNKNDHKQNNININDNNQNENKNKAFKTEFDDPDTPPSSPINTPPVTKHNSNILFDVFENAKLKCRSTFVESFSSYFQPANAPTPPGTPTQELDEDYIKSEEYRRTHTSNETIQQSNFFEQIVNKLSLFSFKSVSNTAPPENSISKTNEKPIIIKPLPIYANTVEQETNQNSDPISTETVFKLSEEAEDEIEIELEMKALVKNCETPPSSPSKFSPPLQYDDCDTSTAELNNDNSAFVRVTSLNPYINNNNKNTIDLASLLGSLSSLKRNQRLCKLY